MESHSFLDLRLKMMEFVVFWNLYLSKNNGQYLWLSLSKAFLLKYLPFATIIVLMRSFYENYFHPFREIADLLW